MEKKKVIGYTQGTFDMFHIGHLNLLRNAKAMCDVLMVGVNRDELVENYKHKKPIIPVEERVEIIKSLRYVDEAFITDSLDKMVTYRKKPFDRLFVGDDWKTNERWLKTKEEMEKIGVEMIFLPYTRGTSSTLIREKLMDYGTEEKDK